MRRYKTRVARAAQQAIEFFELAALAFPREPFAFGFIPLPPPMKEKEAISRLISLVIRCGITCVQFCDAVERETQQRVVARQLFGCRIAEVSEQGEIKLWVLIGEVMDFESFDQRRRACFARQQRRHDDHRARLNRRLSLRVHFGQYAWLKGMRHVPVQHAQRQVGRRNQGEQRHDEAAQRCRVRVVSDEYQRRENQSGE